MKRSIITRACVRSVFLALSLSVWTLWLPMDSFAQAQNPGAVQEYALPRPLAATIQDLPGKLKTLAARPQTPQNSLALGIMQVHSKQYAQAAATLAPVAAKLPEMAGWARFYLGFARFRLGEYQAALAELDAIAPSDPVLGAEALLLSAYCLEGLGSAQNQALERYRRFLELDGQPLRPVALWRAAALASAGGDYPAAEGYLRELILTSPWTSSADKAEPLALELSRAGRIAFAPDSADSLRKRIEVLLDKSMTAKATPLIEQMVRAPGADQARVLYLKAKALYAKRDTQTAVQYFEDAARMATDPMLAAWAVYHQGRCYWRFSGPEDAIRMDELLRDALRRAGALPDGAELAEASRRLLLLSRMERGRFLEALPLAVELSQSGPEATESREQAAWLAGLLRFALEDYAGAEAALAAFAQKYPTSDYAPAVHYWTARAKEAAGDFASAKTSLGRVLSRWPNGYYGMLAARKMAALGAGPVTSEAGAPGASDLDGAGDVREVLAPPTCPPAAGLPPSPEAAQGIARAELLRDLLLPELAERELAALAAQYPKDASVALRQARLATDQGNHLAAVRAVSRAYWPCLTRGSRQDLQPLRDIVYPNRFEELVTRNLVGTDVDPNIIRGLIRQESFFEPDAVSGAGAVGLMQVMPATARTLLEKLGEKGFRPESLKDPAVNVRIGVRFFLERYEEYGGNLPLTLASYNAGQVKVRVWKEFLGGIDPELFVEFIPYTETRDYVKRILGNQAMYLMLYGR
ncbi:MAG: soluble lytic murein [Desulfovibrionaceae bacterium]|nr:MAG: soluble lytic murein [Desulfovibrionaceae bacterium]